MIGRPLPRDMDAFRAYHRDRAETRRRRQEDLRQRVLGRARSAIRSLAPEHPDIRSAALFGSILQPERFTARSDVDIAVDVDDLEAEGRFARALERAIEWPVDVRPLTGPIRWAVEAKGETVYERSDLDPRA